SATAVKPRVSLRTRGLHPGTLHPGTCTRGDDMASDLQSRLDSLRPGDTLKLDPPGREFQGPLTVRNPVVIEGQGGTIWAKQGPVLIVEADGVTLQNVNVEVTGKEAGPDSEGGCALRVLPG